MLKKIKIFPFVLAGLLLVSCNKVKKVESLEEEVEKVNLSFNEYYSTYIGYIDKVSMFDSQYENCDYDGDGLTDRIYRDMKKVDYNGDMVDAVSYRIDFGNGDSIYFGDFVDLFTGIEVEGFDIDSDVMNEILLTGKHEASTFPDSESELAVYKKNEKKGDYEELNLPNPYDSQKLDILLKYKAGYTVYIKEIKDNLVTIYSPNLDFETIIEIESDEATRNYFESSPANEAIGTTAWKIKPVIFNNKPALEMFIHIGFKYFDKDLIVILGWEGEEFIPIQCEIR